MDSNHWKTRAKGGMLRREFISYAVKFVKWTAGILVSVWATDFLAARRERPVTRIVSARGTASGRTTVTGVGESITGTLNVQFEPLRLSASGTVADPPAQIA
jgi:hypothetical protein